MKTNEFTKSVERLVRPIDVGTLHFLQSLNGSLPKNVQKKMVEKSSTKTPYMGFVVEPYSYFLAYEIVDYEWAKKLIPDNFELEKTKVFEDDEPKYYGIFGCFNAHTSGFWGLRVEFYIIAKNKDTGLLSWVIVDYDTNTISYDPKNQLSTSNATDSLLTVDFNGQLYVDVNNNDNERKLIFSSNIEKGEMRPLDKRLWIEGNLSIGYGTKKMGDDAGMFALMFDPHEFDRALDIPVDAFELNTNTWFKGLLKEEPDKRLCFPYAQHYVSDSPGYSSGITNEDELVELVNTLDFSKVDVFSTDSFKKMFKVGTTVSFIVNILLVYLAFFN
jgi:hypothetical protein